MVTWKELEPEINEFAKHLNHYIIYHNSDEHVTIKIYYCSLISDIIRFIRNKTKAAELAATHHFFKLLFKQVTFGNEARCEEPGKGTRFDVFIEKSMKTIEVKTIVQATIDKIRKRAVAIFKGNPVDEVWITWFNKFKNHEAPIPACKYLLSWITIDFMNVDMPRMALVVSQMVEESKRQVAEKLGVPYEIIIPVDNI
ncbi:MAG: hypothetical protein ACTSUE_02075, partial [Promethearchaeota archaeon]